MLREKCPGRGYLFAPAVAFSGQINHMLVMTSGDVQFPYLLGGLRSADMTVETVGIIFQRALKFRERFSGTAQFGE